MTPTAKLDGLLRGTRQPRTQEKGQPYFNIVEKPKLVIVGKPAQPEMSDFERDCYEEYLVIARRMSTQEIERHLEEGTKYSWVIKAYGVVLAERGVR